jgi:AAA family ATP:ADP antiporter
MASETARKTTKSGPVASLLRLFGEVRPGEATTVLLLALNCFVALVAYYVLKVVREPLILNTGGATAKSYAAGVQALVLVALVPLYGNFLARSNRRRLVQGVVIVFIVCIELFWIGAAARVPYLGFVFFVWVGIFSLAVVAQFWSLANDLYDTRTGERLFPVIAIGAPLGSIVGSLLARQLIAAGFGPGGLLQVAAGLLVVHLIIYRLLLARTDAAEHDAPAAADPKAGGAPAHSNGLRLVLQNRYLMLIALLLVALNLVNTTGEFILSAGVTAEGERAFSAALAGQPGLQRAAFLDQFVGKFYAEMFTLVNVATVLLQAFVASRLVRWFGIAGALFALPVVALGAYGLIAAGAGLAFVRYAKVAENSTDYSIMNTARAMLWLPTTRVEKYAGKQAIDTFFVRLGDMISAGVVFLGTLWFGSETGAAADAPRAFALFNLVVIVGWLALAAALTRRYRRLAGDRDPDSKSERPSAKALQGGSVLSGRSSPTTR